MMTRDNRDFLEQMLSALNPDDVFAVGAFLTGYSLGTQAKRSPSS